MDLESAQSFLTAKSNAETIAEEYIVLSTGLEQYFYAVVDGEEMIYPVNYSLSEAESYMRSAGADTLSIYKQDFQQMLYQMKADSDSGLMGGGLMSYLPEQASVNQGVSLLPIIMLINGSMLALAAVVFMIRIRKKSRNSGMKDT